MKKLWLIACCVAAVLACQKQEDTVKNDVNQFDRDFIMKASFINVGILKFSELADTVATDSLVNDYAGMIFVNHKNIDFNFDKVGSGFTYYSKDSLDAAHLAIKSKLDSLSGRAFDSVYIHNQVKEQTDFIALCNDEVSNGLNLQIKNFASAILPQLQLHRNKADSIAKGF